MGDKVNRIKGRVNAPMQKKPGQNNGNEILEYKSLFSLQKLFFFDLA